MTAVYQLQVVLQINGNLLDTVKLNLINNNIEVIILKGYMKLSNHEYEWDFENIFSNYGPVKIKLNISFNGRIIRSVLVGKLKNMKFATH